MAADTLTIDVAMPTHESEPVLEETLAHLAQSERAGRVDINTYHVIDDESNDDTCTIAAECADQYDWDLDVVSQSCSLPTARQTAIERIETEWFLFLDDDARITESYLDTHASAVAPRIGALQGRKSSQTTINDPEPTTATSDEPHPSSWVHHRAFRGGTHATLIRREAVSGITFPEDLTVWEDQYLRRYIESHGYLWVFNHQARFHHRTQNPRQQGWTEGYLQGKYNLRPAWHVGMGIPHTMMTGSSTYSSILQLAGYTTGRMFRSFR